MSRAEGPRSPAPETAQAPEGRLRGTPRRTAETPLSGSGTEPGPGAVSGAAPQPGASPRPGAESGPASEAPAHDGAHGPAPEGVRTLAFVESPVQLLNVLEWAFRDGLLPGPAAAADTGSPAAPLTVVVLAPHDPMTRGQLRRVAELARDEGVTVQWQEARGGASAPLKTIASLAGPLRRAKRVVVGDPFSRYVQLLLTLTPASSVVVVDDGTATMEFVAQIACGERLVRWHRTGSGGAAAALFAPFSHRARSRLTPGSGRRVEIFSSMPVEDTAEELGVVVTANEFAWTRHRFGPPRLTRGTDLVGTSLVETGVVDLDRYLEAVADLARTHGATRYFAHRRESADKLARVTARTGLEIVRPDLPLELVARRGPIGATILSFPSTVVHTLPLALAGTTVTVGVCDVDSAWLTEGASPRAEGFLSGVTGSARGVRRLDVKPPGPAAPPGPPGAAGAGGPGVPATP